MKKVGVILSIFFVVLAVAIMVFVSMRSNKKEDSNPTNTSAVVSTQKPSNSQKPVEKEEPSATVTPIPTPTPQIVEKVVEKIVEKKVSEVQTVNENALSRSKTISKVIAVISNKRILLLDEKVGETNNKMYTYCFDVLTPAPENKPLTLFVTSSVYDQFKTGDRLMVTYQNCKYNDIEAPIVISVESVE